MSEVYKSDTYLNSYCNAGTSITNIKGKFGNATFGKGIESWVHPGIANIISILVMKKLGFHILYNIDDTKGYITVIFHKEKQGLPYINLQDNEQGVAFVRTVHKSFEVHNKQDVKKSIAALEAPTMLGCQSDRDMEYLVNSKELDDCPATPHDLRNANWWS